MTCFKWKTNWSSEQNTCMTYCPAYVPVIVELWPEASRAIAKSLELQLPKTFYKNNNLVNGYAEWNSILLSESKCQKDQKDSLHNQPVFNKLQSHTLRRKEALFKSKSWQLFWSTGFKLDELQTAPLTEITDTFMKNATSRAIPLSIK